MWNKFEWDNPAKAGAGGLGKFTSEAYNSDLLNDADYTNMFNVILYIAMSE